MVVIREKGYSTRDAQSSERRDEELDEKKKNLTRLYMDSEAQHGVMGSG
jgi:hypothetical protein